MPLNWESEATLEVWATLERPSGVDVPRKDVAMGGVSVYYSGVVVENYPPLDINLNTKSFWNWFLLELFVTKPD
jgi:hypothetical protein